MTVLLKVISLLATALLCNGYNEKKPLPKIDDSDTNVLVKNLRRVMNLPSGSVIIGAPSYPNHLPEAEPILPGHTLIRPGLGMLKSSLKFPHRELEGGSGVYGNEDNLGIRFDGRHERVLYTKYRRSNANKNPGIILILPNTSGDMTRTSVTDLDALEQIKSILEGIVKVGRRTVENYTDITKPDIQAEAELSENRIPQRSSNHKSNVDIDDTVKEEKRHPQKTYSKRLPDRPNFMGHYRKDNQILEDLIAILRNTQRRQDNIVRGKDEGSNKKYRIVDDSSAESDEPENISLMKTVETTYDVESQTEMPRKKALFLKTKDLYTHIKINQNAPDYHDLMPKKITEDDLADVRNWWFYNQVDHTEFED